MPLHVLRLLLMLMSLVQVGAALSAHAQSPARAPLVAGRGTLRLDLAPPDFAYMDHGWINDRRGFRLEDGGADTTFALGLGLGYGVTSALELGALALPIRFSPGTDVEDLEFYGRYALSAAVALQATVQLPTQTRTGLGFGVPLHFTFGAGHAIDTGVEVEFLLYAHEIVNLDVPLAVQWALGRTAFAGVRSGLLFVDLDEMWINLGAQAGVRLAPEFDLKLGVDFPAFLRTGPGDPISADGWRILFGATVRTQT